MSVVDEVQNKVINPLIAKLDGITDEIEIKLVTIDAWDLLNKIAMSEGSRKRQQTRLRKEIEKVFPESQEPKPGYYFTKSGKAKSARYEHLSLWYTTTNEGRWDIVGDEARANYFKNLKPFHTEKPSETIEQLPEEQQETRGQTIFVPLVEETIEQLPIEQQETLTQQKTFTFETMKLEDLRLDTKTEQIIASALEHSGKSLPDFLRQAAKVYANTIEGRVGQAKDDLTTVSTTDLLKEPKYKTHPGKPLELTKRAIKAIKLHNGNATETKEKWAITQSLISEITGSRPQRVKEALSQFRGDVDDYNASLRLECGLNDDQFTCFNRKGEEANKPDLVALVPDGFDD